MGCYRGMYRLRKDYKAVDRIKRRSVKILLLVLVISMLLVSCVASTGTEDGSYKAVGTMFTRQIDREAGVVCWSVGASISCLPMDQTLLR